MEKEQIREIIAKRVAMELKDGDVVNLGIGLPTAVPDYLPEGVQIFLQSENGLLGMGPTPATGRRKTPNLSMPAADSSRPSRAPRASTAPPRSASSAAVM